MRPKELDVPHWARDQVATARKDHDLPPAVTDRMIFARLVALGQDPPLVRREGLRSLKEEVTA